MQNNISGIKNKSRKGFTLVELLLVIIIAGAILVVVVPRAFRANVDSKYTLLRQSCTELASNANKWAQQQVDLQPSIIGTTAVTSSIRDYMDTLAGVSASNPVWLPVPGNWVGTFGSSLTPQINVNGRANTTPTNTVSSMFPPNNLPKNPFNGASLFILTNNPAALNRAIPGATACGWDNEAATNLRYYALIFQGTDNENNSTFHAGQDSTINGLRNGVFINRY